MEAGNHPLPLIKGIVGAIIELRRSHNVNLHAVAALLDHQAKSKNEIVEKAKVKDVNVPDSANSQKRLSSTSTDT